MMNKNYAQKKEKGFTLIEIMVVLVISVILLFALYNLFLSSFRGVLAGKSKLGNLQDAAITLEYIKQDVKGGYFKKTNISGKEIDGETLFKGGDGFLEFSNIGYEASGEEKLYKITYTFDKQTESLIRAEENGPTRSFAKGKIKKFMANLVKFGKVSYVDVILKVEADNKQKVELRNAIFPKDIQAVNKNWIPNPY